VRDTSTLTSGASGGDEDDEEEEEEAWTAAPTQRLVVGSSWPRSCDETFESGPAEKANCRNGD
jgi:hypothetical protein